MIRTGTSHFVNMTAAIRYYRDYGYEDARAAVERKLEEGEIHIGEPPLKPGQRLALIDDATRFAIEEG